MPVVPSMTVLLSPLDQNSDQRRRFRFFETDDAPFEIAQSVVDAVESFDHVVDDVGQLEKPPKSLAHGLAAHGARVSVRQSVYERRVT